MNPALKVHSGCKSAKILMKEKVPFLTKLLQVNKASMMPDYKLHIIDQSHACATFCSFCKLQNVQMQMHQSSCPHFCHPHPHTHMRKRTHPVMLASHRRQTTTDVCDAGRKLGILSYFCTAPTSCGKNNTNP